MGRCLKCDRDGCNWSTFHVCRVCQLVDNDTTIKAVCFCNLCKAHICKDHWKDAFARIEAAGKVFIEKVKRKYVKKK